jgi:hypothetical protein
VPVSDLPSLHDAVFDSLTVDWAGATAAFRFTLVGGDRDQQALAIHGSGLRTLFVPREQPWGPSLYVNRAQLSEGEIAEIRIEMQSGDEIVLLADSIHWS